MIIAGMSPTAERKQNIDFSEPYYTSDLVMIVKKGSKYESAASIADVEGATVVAQIGTVHDEVIDQIPDVIKAMADFPAMRISLNRALDAYAPKARALSIEAGLDFVCVEFEEGKGFSLPRSGGNRRQSQSNERLAKSTDYLKDYRMSVFR